MTTSKPTIATRSGTLDFIQDPEPILWVQESVLGIFGTSWGLLLAVAVGFWFFGRRVVYGLLAVSVVAALVVLSSGSPDLWRWGGFVVAVAVALPLEWKFVRYHPSEELGLRLRCALLGSLGVAPGVFLHLSGDERSPSFEAGVLCLATLWALLLAPTLFVRWGWSADEELERRSAVRYMARVTGVGMAAVLGVLVYGSLVEPRLLLDVREETGTVADLPDAWRGARVAVIADMQVGMWGDNTRMIRRVAERIARDSPDLVLIAGDFIYKPGADATDEAREAVEILSSLARTEIPVFAVLGNHDWSMDKEGAPVDERAGLTIERALEDAGIEVLDNEAREVQHASGAGTLWVVGVGSHWAGKDRPADAVAAVPPGAARLVVMHHPDSFESIPAGQTPLAVAGHTHGGQFRLPFLPDWTWMTFAGGDEVHSDGWVGSDYGEPGNRLYVNRGIGFSLIPVRIRARAELTYFTLDVASGVGS